MPSVRNFTLAAVLLAGLGLALPALSAPEGGFGHGLMGWQKIHDQLNVTTSQQVLWDAAVAASKSAHDTVRQNHQQLHQAVQAELAKDPPDLAALAAQHDSVRQANQAALLQARNAWLQVYASLTADQKTIVKNFLLTRLQRMEKFREHMKHRMMPNG